MASCSLVLWSGASQGDIAAKLSSQRLIIIWLAGQQNQLQAVVHAAAQHLLQTLEALLIAVGKGVVEYQWQAIGVSRLEHLRQGQA